MAFITNSVFLGGSWTQRTSEKKVCNTLSPSRRAAARGLTVVRRPVVPAPHSPVALQVREVSAEELEIALQANARPMLVDAFASKFQLFPFTHACLCVNDIMDDKNTKIKWFIDISGVYHWRCHLKQRTAV